MNGKTISRRRRAGAAAVIAGLVLLAGAAGVPAAAQVALVSHRAVYDLVAEVDGAHGQRDGGTLHYTYANTCDGARIDVVLETSTMMDGDTLVTTTYTLTEEEVLNGERYTMVSVSQSRTANGAGTVIGTETAEIAAEGVLTSEARVLTVVDRSFDVNREETIALPDVMAFPVTVLRQRLDRAAAGEPQITTATLAPDRRTVVTETTTVIAEVNGAQSFSASPEAASLLDAAGWRFEIERSDGESVLGREDSVILGNGIVVDSIYTTGLLRSIATLRTVEPIADEPCE